MIRKTRPKIPLWFLSSLGVLLSLSLCFTQKWPIFFMFLLGLLFWTIVFRGENTPIAFLALFYYIIVLMIIRAGIKHFPMFPQAKALYDVNPDLVFWLRNGNVHAVRLALVYPGVLIANAFGLTVDLGCSYYTALLFYVTYACILQNNRLLSLSSSYHRSIAPLLAMVPMLILPFIMNGRLAFAFCGMSILMLTLTVVGKQKRINVKLFICLCVGIVLCMVSTGTMLVAIVCVGFLLLKKYRWYIHINWLGSLAGSAALIVLGVYIYDMIKKLFAYYGPGLGGFLGILQHGAGKLLAVLLDKTPFLLLVFLLSPLTALIAIRLSQLFFTSVYTKRPLYDLYSATTISMCGMIFGYSTGLMFIVPAITIACYLCPAVDGHHKDGYLKNREIRAK